ncbi:hypothetical protein GUITHDRAFT_141716 [Guillardia theta CCMP2712]|uniref:Acyltransferase 3 domain-containing protein n=1 Tax=Guillardia theta (strain CCMP2712) TaxID=905079 RepID=L1IZL3_GUITC|nr:hypothetical protein GUITHDRAFT_141716 [Guillardia theta CCMP2712]EKX41713.1 hypothetical protein GUITHDRAFT_141716 [Guillardia theta CCMP2712]|eukprot:XP_005828693.1 hypothetical protein GUITHDRAFT_141716 [Guillardia theta CCMP2712]
MSSSDQVVVFNDSENASQGRETQTSRLAMSSISVDESREAMVETPVSCSKPPRLHYLDKLRTFLTLLVVVHHCFWVVQAGWVPFQRPWQTDNATTVIQYMILAGNQAFFMGLFFFLAGLVTIPSLKRKGAKVFLKDRFYRLMVPAILYDLIGFPFLWVVVEAAWNSPMKGSIFSFGKVWTDYFMFYKDRVFVVNHMWFTVTLFAFNLTLVCVPEKYIFVEHSIESMSKKEIMIVLMKMSLVLFVLNCVPRFLLPDGYIWIPVYGNLGFLMQYSSAFVAGILANSYQFLDHIHMEHLSLTLTCSTVFYFLFQIFQVYLFEVIRGTMGFYPQTLFLTLFEQSFAVFWAYSLLVLFKEYQNGNPTQIQSQIIGSAYATYIIHQWIIVPLAIAFAYTNLYPLVVSLILSLVSPFLAWGVGIALKAIPGSSIIL